MLTWRWLSSLAQLPARDWLTLQGTHEPFLRHEFLLALESSGSVGQGTGWLPRYLLVEDAATGTLLAALPAWHKTHSWGEYVFDQEWARAYARYQLDYYPKLLLAVPFTPATTPRLLRRPDVPWSTLLPALQQALQSLPQQPEAYSGWHVLFPPADELPLWQQLGGLLRTGCQFHWHNRGYACFDDFLARFTARRRKEIRRERRRVAEQGLQLQRLTGSDLRPEHAELFIPFYQDTYRRRSGHDGYLRPEFFRHLFATLPEQLLLVLAWRDGVAVGGALSLIGSDTLYGRYWGATDDFECLHFEACLYQGIEFCIERGLQRFDPGAQGEHKIPRGFTPVLTYSLHCLHHEGFQHAIARFLAEESRRVQRYQQEAATLLPFRTCDETTSSDTGCT